MYDPVMVEPMRQELAVLGIEETKTADAVLTALGRPGTTLAVINSVCGCAAANARPAVNMAMKNAKLPDNAITVFAGNDREATQVLRENIVGYPPSSPNIVLFKDGEVAFNLERHQIEGRAAEDIAQDLIEAFNQFC